MTGILEGQRVLITAGGSGIGKTMAEAFAESGARVWVVDVNGDSLDGCPSEWRRDRVDVSDPDGMSDLFRRIGEAWQGLDALCANAGTPGPTALLEDQPVDGFRACLAVNVEGAFLASKGALPMMKAAGRGSIVFTSSTAGLYGFPLRAPYAAAKWAINGLMKTVAMEAGPYGVRANVVAPGCVEGPRIDGVIAREAAAKGMSPEAVRSAYEGGTSMRTFVTARDIANMAVFLSSPAAARVSGQIIAVDGHTENPDPKAG
ncbi:SDR family oxidoreductase [Pseudaminobacter sp. 19-2017]|uniref:SDR family oxidoreductase n=1 Tax=Pseudaminobacter soli (ex Zhang et al. 2022) TaxID=2831468 RepID=A0A942I9V5_9HYPH|nr:SDR family oxidoreductase [Pseudaminobacter soli]MBS3650705.1 SDR family oxidoreductase [Pseudaminobacter soli]